MRCSKTCVLYFAAADVAMKVGGAELAYILRRSCDEYYIKYESSGFAKKITTRTLKTRNNIRYYIIYDVRNNFHRVDRPTKNKKLWSYTYMPTT